MKSLIGTLLILIIICTTEIWCQNTISTLAVMFIASLAFQYLVLTGIEVNSIMNPDDALDELAVQYLESNGIEIDPITNCYGPFDDRPFIDTLLSQLSVQKTVAEKIQKALEAAHLRSQLIKSIKKHSEEIGTD